MEWLKHWDDQRTENFIGNLLRVGVMLAASVVSFGAILFLHKYWRMPSDYRAFHGEPENFRTLSGIFHEATALHGRGIIQFGLVLLMATPIARVIFSVWAFTAERDRMYVGFTLIVLAVLLYSFLGTGI
ncbi:MAG TPA: DUF1634 domain-containing protein [Terriglobales bacterium]|jgi:uncharacterized membrane protein